MYSLRNVGVFRAIWENGTFQWSGGAHTDTDSKPGVANVRPWGICIFRKTRKNGSDVATGTSSRPTRKHLIGSSWNASARVVDAAGMSSSVTCRTPSNPLSAPATAAHHTGPDGI